MAAPAIDRVRPERAHPAPSGGVRPLAWFGAAALHGAALLLLVRLPPAVPSVPPPEIAITLEVLPAPEQATAAQKPTSAAPATPISVPDPAPAPEPEQAPPLPMPDADPAPAPEHATTVPMPTPEANAPTPPPDLAPEPEMAAPPIPDATPFALPADPTAPEAVAQAPPSPPERWPVPPTPDPPLVTAPHLPPPSRRTPQPRTMPARPKAEAQTASAQPAPAPATPAPPAAASASSAAVSPSWESQLSAWLQAHKRYPETARARGEEGTASLRFTVAHDGHVLAVSLVRGSGSALLDEAALDLLRDARVPPFPDAMPEGEIAVTVAIRYTLER